MNPLKAANPITLTKGAFGLAGTAVGLAGGVARGVVHAPVDLTRGAFHVAGAAADVAGNVARETVHALRTTPGDARADRSEDSRPASETDEAGVGTDTGGAPGPTVVVAEPHAPEEPPVDVVGEALAAEEAAERGEAPLGAGFAHEPRAASRDEGHGDAALQRATVEEIAEETAAALQGDVEPEEHLTAPLVDPADARSVAAELATMSRAADTEKG